MSSMCFATTNTEKISLLLQDVYAENPEFRDSEENIKAEICQRLNIARERNYSNMIVIARMRKVYMPGYDKSYCIVSKSNGMNIDVKES